MDDICEIGHGLVVESHMGRVRITDSLFLQNYGNGIKHKSLDGRFYVFDERDTFCMRSAVTGAQNYPLFIMGIPRSGTTSGGSYSCGMVITYNCRMLMSLYSYTCGMVIPYNCKMVLFLHSCSCRMA